jgi:predicted nuclease with TOPRIM domain
MKRIALSTIVAISVLGTSAFGAKENSNSDNTNFLNGKPFSYLNTQLTDQEEAIATLQSQVISINTQIVSIDTQISSMKTSIEQNEQDIETIKTNLSNTNSDVESLRQVVMQDIQNLQSLKVTLQSQVDGLQTQITQLTAQLSLELQSLQDAIENNSANLNTISIRVSTLNAQILVLNSTLNNQESNLNLLGSKLDSLEALVAQLDIRLISVETDVAVLQSNQTVPKSCKQILDLNPSSLSGTYQIDPDGEGERPVMDVYCDMDYDGGGWTNLNFSTNQVLLENDHSIQCSTLSATQNGITCQSPKYENNGYLYHYRCDGNDNTADYLIDHVGAIVGHNQSDELGFTTLSQRYTGQHGTSTPSQDEYLYISGELVSWRDELAREYSNNMNGNCVPGFFSLSY